MGVLRVWACIRALKLCLTSITSVLHSGESVINDPSKPCRSCSRSAPAKRQKRPLISLRMSEWAGGAGAVGGACVGALRLYLKPLPWEWSDGRVWACIRALKLYLMGMHWTPSNLYEGGFGHALEPLNATFHHFRGRSGRGGGRSGAGGGERAGGAGEGAGRAGGGSSLTPPPLPGSAENSVVEGSCVFYTSSLRFPGFMQSRLW